MVSMFACACLIDTFGFNRATHSRKLLLRSSVIGCAPFFDSRKVDIVVQASGGTELIGKENRGGMMPTT